ncbi:Glycosyltransferase family 2 protein [Rhodovastum atsumiense]|nr:Glycosyltransferase family 2 protein [Rhodovastum atsumiense]
MAGIMLFYNTNDLPMQSSEPDLSIIIVFYKTSHLIEPLMAALDASTSHLSVETIIVDNASCDGSVARLRERVPSARIIENERNVGFGRANNQALAVAHGRFLLLLNTDAFVAPETLLATVRAMEEHPDWGILGVRLVGPDGSDQPSCRHFPTPANIFLNATGLGRVMPWVKPVDDPLCKRDVTQECDWVPGCYFLIRRSVVEQIGVLDSRFFMYYEEVDYCRRAKAAGWKVVYFPGTRVIHLGGVSAERLGPLAATIRQVPALQLESEILYFRKHLGLPGLLTIFMLTLAANAIVRFKAAVRQKQPRPEYTGLPSSFALIITLLQTRCGLRPTR